MAGKFRILVVDDEASVRESLQDWLSEEGYEMGLAESGFKAVELVKNQSWNVVLLDLKMPGMDGLETLRKIKETAPNTEVIMMTAYATMETAVQSIKEGAYDYLVKPFDPKEMDHRIKKITAHQELLIENILLKKQLKEQVAFGEIVGQSPKMIELFELIEQVAPTDSTVLITGESGTGKELVARAIHTRSRRCYQPFIAVSSAALPETLLESELFGFEKGAFTGADRSKKGRFELADGGTLFLDEIGDVSLKTQANLLRVLEERAFQRIGGTVTIEVDVRILTATNRDLKKAIAEGAFREDLFYRLNVISIPLPPLRERREDIPLLTRHFIEKFSFELNRPQKDISAEAMGQLLAYNWPGNVRELKNIMERAMVISKLKEILPQDLPFLAGTTGKPGPVPDSLEEMEKLHITRLLVENNWNISRSAEKLNIDRQTLYNKINKYKLSR
jgi:DNA-binding NtrC family response regulator